VKPAASDIDFLKPEPGKTMSYQTNHELLNEFRTSVELIREVNTDLEHPGDPDLRDRIADHMRTWEDVLNRTLSECENDMGKGTENTFTQATPHVSPVDRIRKHLPAPEDPPARAQWCMQRHEELADWCGTLAGQSVSERTTELFQRLADHIRDLNRQLATDTRSLETR
jgi:hypothetical protein